MGIADGLPFWLVYKDYSHTLSVEQIGDDDGSTYV